MRSRLGAGSALVALIVAVGACGGDGDPPAGDAATPTATASAEPTASPRPTKQVEERPEHVEPASGAAGTLEMCTNGEDDGLLFSATGPADYSATTRPEGCITWHPEPGTYRLELENEEDLGPGCGYNGTHVTRGDGKRQNASFPLSTTVTSGRTTRVLLEIECG